MTEHARKRRQIQIVGATLGVGAVKIEVNQTYALADTASAHRDLEGRTTTGSSVLLP